MMRSLLRSFRTLSLRFGVTAAVALTGPAFATADDPPENAPASTDDAAASAPSGSVTDFLTFDAEPDAATPSGDGSSKIASVPPASSGNDPAGSVDER